jgi:hypothetical protein
MINFPLFYMVAIATIAFTSISHANADTFSNKLECKKLVEQYEKEFPRVVDGFATFYPKYDEMNGRCLVYIYANSKEAIVERVDDALTHDGLASNVLYKGKPMKTWEGTILDKRYKKTTYGKICSVWGCDKTGYYEAQDYIEEIKKMD